MNVATTGQREGQTVEVGLTELQELWWTHDTLWYTEVARRVGFEAANAINQAVLPLVTKRVARLLLKQRGQPQTVEEMVDFLRAGDALVFPPRTRPEWTAEVIGSDEVLVNCIRCHPLERVRRAGVAEQYECPCFAYRSGFFEVLGLGFEMKVLSNMKDGAEKCEIRVKIQE